MAKGKHAAALFEVIQSDKRARPTGSAIATPGWFKRRTPTANAAPNPAAKPVSVDPDRQVVAFRLSYTNLGIAAFAVVVIIVLAYVLGRHGTTTPPAGAEPQTVATTEVRGTTLQPEVLSVQTTASQAMAVTDHPAPPSEQAPAATVVPGDARRIVGLNYVIVQSYPDEKSATEARDILLKSGIQCTVEKGPAGWAAASWFSVVGTTGFDRIRNVPEYDQYIKAIEAVSAKFAGNSRFKRFEPRAYKWKAQ